MALEVASVGPYSAFDGASVTERAVARVFVSEYDGRLAYCHSTGRWYEFDGHIWRAHTQPRAFHYIAEMATSISAFATNKATLQKAAFCLSVEKFARSDPLLSTDANGW